jgi:rRNA maturation endonuclease Nob1
MYDKTVCELCGHKATEKAPVLDLETLEFEFGLPERLDGYVYVCEECADVEECEYCGITVPSEDWDHHECYGTAGEAWHAERVEQDYR